MVAQIQGSNAATADSISDDDEIVKIDNCFKRCVELEETVSTKNEIITKQVKEMNEQAEKSRTQQELSQKTLEGRVQELELGHKRNLDEVVSAVEMRFKTYIADMEKQKADQIGSLEKRVSQLISDSEKNKKDAEAAKVIAEEQRDFALKAKDEAEAAKERSLQELRSEYQANIGCLKSENEKQSELFLTFKSQYEKHLTELEQQRATDIGSLEARINQLSADTDSYKKQKAAAEAAKTKAEEEKAAAEAAKARAELERNNAEIARFAAEGQTKQLLQTNAIVEAAKAKAEADLKAYNKDSQMVILGKATTAAQTTFTIANKELNAWEADNTQTGNEIRRFKNPQAKWFIRTVWQHKRTPAPTDQERVILKASADALIAKRDQANQSIVDAENKLKLARDELVKEGLHIAQEENRIANEKIVMERRALEISVLAQRLNTFKARESSYNTQTTVVDARTKIFAEAAAAEAAAKKQRADAEAAKLAAARVAVPNVQPKKLAPDLRPLLGPTDQAMELVKQSAQQIVANSYLHSVVGEPVR